MKVLLDHRLGNTPLYYLGEEDDGLMLVPDEIRKCVVFIMYVTKDGSRMAGTAFFVGLPSSTAPEKIYPYLVTAKHVIEAVKRNSIDGKVYLRINLKDKPSALIGSNINQWKYHPTANNVDVAVLGWAPDQTVYDYRIIPSSMVATPEIIAREGISCGDEVFLTGLFSNHYGQQKNIPIIRIGNIACMPEELVQTQDLGAIDAYLIEARSIGGLSGSPVFVHLSGVRKGSLSLGNDPIYWLGLMHGHFDLSTLERDEVTSDNLIDLKVNMGIAIVIPVSKILEVLNQSEFAEIRKKEDEIFRLQKAASPDTTLTT